MLATEPGPATIIALIREVEITADHWYLWPNRGTRVAGNLCHWIDLAFHLLGPGPRAVEVAVSPRVSDDPRDADAERAFTITFDDGSVATLMPTTRGDSVRGVQEQIEIRRGGLALRLDDLWRLNGLRAGCRSATGRCGAARATARCTARRSSASRPATPPPTPPPTYAASARSSSPPPRRFAPAPPRPRSPTCWRRGAREAG